VSQESHPTSRRRLLIGLLAAVVALAVVAVVAAVFLSGGSKSKAPSTPSAAAQQWATALIAHDANRVRGLQCSQGSEQSSLFGLTNAVATGVKVKSTTQTGSSWTVVLDVQAPGGAGTQFPVPVVRQDDKYLVC
jgi:hypothetical protein